MNLKNKKYFYFSILGLFLVIGVSYAFIFFIERFEGNNLGLITELLDVKISENGVVSMANATGQKDSEGIENERTTFNIINNNKVPIRVVIKLVEDNNSNMDINQVRFGILVSGKIMNVGNLGENDGVLLDFQMNPGQDATLESTIWLDYFYNGGTNTEIFSGKYVVEASNVDDYGYMYLKNLVGKNKGLVAINTDGELAQEGDEIREYRYSGSAKYCTYTVDGGIYNISVEKDVCPNICVSGWYKYIERENDSCSTNITPNQTKPLDGEVDNYIWFNNEMWRIIGVFNETTGNGKTEELIKIIRDEPLRYDEVPRTYTYNGKTMTIKNTSENYPNYKYAYMYWNYENYFGQTNQNDWTKASLQYYLNDATMGANSYYNSINYEYKKMIETVQYNISNLHYNSVDTTAISAYSSERNGTAYDGNKYIWKGKIGIMYPSDYGYAASSAVWTSSINAYGAFDGSLSNWMNDNIRGSEWTISTTSSGDSFAADIWVNGGLGDSDVWAAFAVSPVLYLKSDVLITAGNGSEEKPYQVERPELVRIPTTATNTIKSKVGTDGLVAINTNGELAGKNDTIREYRYSGSSKYCTYTIDGNTYQLEVDGDTCPNACYSSDWLIRADNDYFVDVGGVCPREVSSNESTPIDGEVDNYIWFNNEMWRIIGVFNEKDSDGNNKEVVKIMRDEQLKMSEVPAEFVYNETTMQMLMGTYITKYASINWNEDYYFNQTNLNDWTKAAIQYYLNDETNGANSYYNSIDLKYKKMIETVQYDISNVSVNNLVKEIYNNERSGIIYPDNNSKWIGKVGLMYPSDYGYAFSTQDWSRNLNSNLLEYINWMNDSKAWIKWTISPSTDDAERAISIGVAGDLGSNGCWSNYTASPVLYLKSDVLITAGNGSEEDPYIVERYEMKKKPTKVVDEIKSKVGTDGIVAINTNGELADDNDKIREYRYSGSARYCTYTVDGSTYQLEVDSDTCPSACYDNSYLYRYDNEMLTKFGGTCNQEVKPNQTTPINGEVDNYVEFNNEMWRIIGVFNTEKENGQNEELVKIIRDEPFLNSELPKTYTYNGVTTEVKVNYSPYTTMKYASLPWSKNSQHAPNANVNDWTQAFLQYYLNDETSGMNSYYNGLGKQSRNMIQSVSYNLGNVSDTKTANETYLEERSGNIWDGNKEKWIGKIGIMYASDYLYASSNLAWNTTYNLYGNISNASTLKNWINDDVAYLEWTISPSPNFHAWAMTISNTGQVYNENVQSRFHAVSPVLYLKNGVLVTDGDGSYNNPYKLG